MTPLDPSDLLDLYWAGRTTLVSRRDDIRPTTACSASSSWTRGRRRRPPDADGQRRRGSARRRWSCRGPSQGPDEEEEKPVLGWMASDVDALKHRSFAACTPAELAALRRIMTRIRLTPPRRRTRRTRPAASGSHAGSAQDHQGLDADARRARRAVLPPAQDAAAPAHPDPRRVRLDGRLLAAPAPVRAYGEARSRQGRGVLLRHQAYPHHRALEHRRPDSALEQAARRWSTGTAAPGSASRWTPLCGASGAAGCAGAESW